jgi:2-polyprenyl-3-methyl-5-hydroxy-6-metoxy-1,4-benzoquinol methylase
MEQANLKNSLGKVDIYLLDQLMKNRYSEEDLILDAGCGTGRNFNFMSSLGFNITGCDLNENEINNLKAHHPFHRLDIANLDDLPYSTNHFDHIICNAVLHFAKNEIEFKKMISELYRVLKPNGTLFIRMTSEFGIEKIITPADGQFLLPDNSYRFLLNTELLNNLNLKFEFIEPLKTVNVNNLRCMSTLVLRRKL